jgi:hypothetical protein
MRADALTTLRALAEALDQVRERVNYSHRHHALMRTRMDAYNTICSAMDTVHTCAALRSKCLKVPKKTLIKAGRYRLRPVLELIVAYR